MSTGELTCGYLTQEIRAFQLSENCIDALFKAKEAHQPFETKGQSIEYTSPFVTVGTACHLQWYPLVMLFPCSK